MAACGERDAAASFSAIRALSRSLEVSTFGTEMQLSELVDRTPEPYAVDRSAFALEGDPDVLMKPAQALPISMEHGALSVKGGRVRVSWNVE